MMQFHTALAALLLGSLAVLCATNEAGARTPSREQDVAIEYAHQVLHYLSELSTWANRTDAEAEFLRSALHEMTARLSEEAAAPAPSSRASGPGTAAPAAVAPRPSLRAARRPVGEAFADPGAFSLRGRGADAKFRAVLEGPMLKAASPSMSPAEQQLGASWSLNRGEPVNPFLFKFDGRLLRFTPKPSLCASVREGRIRTNADVILWTCQDGDEFAWAFVGDQIVLSTRSQYCLSLRDGKTGPGSRAALLPCSDAVAGRWVVDGERIRYAGNKNYCLSVREGLAGDGSDLILWACDVSWRIADWIIVGGGASGCAAAAALADAGESVLVLERGQSDLDIPETQQAQTWPRVVNTEAAEAIRWTDGTWGAVAKVLGGGTAINGGLYIEEEPAFFNETFSGEVDLEELYASSRFLAADLTAPLQPSTYGSDFEKALQEVGLASDANSALPQVRWSEGSWVAYSTINTTEPGRWPRRGAAELLHERAALPNLEVLTEYEVQRIVFEGKRATGVWASFKGQRAFLPSRKGVVLATGAIYTPQLLQLSGVGDAALLQKLGVEVVSDLPEVGRNFIDRPVSTVGVWSAIDLPLHIGYAVNVNRELQLTTESEAGGRVASEFTVASLAFAPPSGRTEFLRWSLELLFSTPVADLMNNMMQLVALQHSPKSRGRVVATSTNAATPPQVTANHLADPDDMSRQLAALNKLLEVASSPALQPYARPKIWAPPLFPLPDFLSCFFEQPGQKTSGIVFPCLPSPGSSEERWQEYVRNTVVSSYHYFGTAAMGTVVEGPDFSVKGTENLHVVDASIFPRPTHVNPQGTIMAVGHYAGKRLAALGSQRRLSMAAAAPSSEAGAPPSAEVGEGQLLV